MFQVLEGWRREHSSTKEIQILTPGTPGSVWTKEETEIVRRKVIELMRYDNWSPDTRDGLFWTDGTLDGSRGISWVEDKWCEVRSWVSF